MDEFSLLFHRNPKSFKNKNIKILLESKKLFYWIPEMINYPQQKYVADPSMARRIIRRFREKIRGRIEAFTDFSFCLDCLFNQINGRVIRHLKKYCH